jgi:hypothetical protein
MKQSLQFSDITDITNLLNNEGLGVVAIAQKYGVPESTMRYFISSNNINYKKKRSGSQRKTTQLSGFETQPTHQAGNIFNSVPQLSQQPAYIPIPNSNDPQVLSYLLSLKTLEAQNLSKNFHELELDYKRLKNDYTDLEIAQKHFDREKQLAIEDAVRNKGGFDLEKGMEKLNQNPILSQALAGVITKVMNVPSEGAQLAGVNGNNPLITEFFNELTKKPTDLQNKVASVAFFLMEDPNWLEQTLAQVKARQGGGL